MQAFGNMGSKKIVVLGTGGTIAGRSAVVGDNVGYTAGQVAVSDLLVSLPDVVGATVLAEQIAQVDSKDMGFAIWQALLTRVHHWVNVEKVDGVVITHGTDTLEETAYFLHSALDTAVPVVLTCAMRPASSQNPDGPQNMRDALVLAQHAVATGVVVVCAGVIHSAADVQKLYPYRLDAFVSGDAGVLGYVEEGQIRQCRPWQAPLGACASASLQTLTPQAWPYVEVIFSYAGCTGAVVDALLALPPQARPQGLVVAATGNGTLHTSLLEALNRAQAQGLRVILTTRCTLGPMVPGAAWPFEALPGSSPVKARIALMLRLMG
jgi:L-asparaginase